MEYSERNTEETARKPFLGTGLWHRVQRLNEIVSGYMQSSFVKAMDKNYIRPPVMRTNAILKNKYFNECLALWEFIESYEDAGYGITVSETVKDVPDEYVKEIYALAAQNYLVFLHNAGKPVKDAAEYEYSAAPEVKAEIDTARGAVKEEFRESLPDYTAENDEIAFALDVALLADDLAEPTSELFGTRYVRTFHSKIRTAPLELKERFARIANELLKFGKVKMRESKRFASFHAGRTILARVTVSGKALKVYFAEAENAADNMPREEEPRFEDTPVCLRVRGSGGERRATAYIAALAEAYGLKLAKKPPEPVSAENYPLVPLAEMLRKGWIFAAKRKITDFAAEKGLFRGLGNFGTAVSEESSVAAEEVKKNAVSESAASFLAPNAAAVQQESPAAEYKRPSAAQTLENMVRPEGNYEKPTDYGLDDSTGFILDEEQSARTEEEREADGENGK